MTGSGQRLNGKVVVVSGAGRGIGAATARVLGGRCARLALGARSASELRAVADSIGGDVAVLPTDVTRPGDVQALVDLGVERFGRVDVFVANAGVAINAPLATGSLTTGTRRGDRATRCLSPHGRAVRLNISDTTGIKAHLGDWRIIPVVRALFVEGVHSSRQELMEYADLALWVTTSEKERVRRQVERGQNPSVRMQPWLVAENYNLERVRPFDSAEGCRPGRVIARLRVNLVLHPESNPQICHLERSVSSAFTACRPIGKFWTKTHLSQRIVSG